MSTDLETLMSEFNFWRQGGNYGQVPKHLKQKVIELSKQYSFKQLASHLNLKEATIRQWQRRTSLAEESTLVSPVDFVRLTQSKKVQAVEEDSLNKLKLTIELSNGIKLLLSGQNPNELIELASGLAKRLSA